MFILLLVYWKEMFFNCFLKGWLFRSLFKRLICDCCLYVCDELKNKMVIIINVMIKYKLLFFK